MQDLAGSVPTEPQNEVWLGRSMSRRLTSLLPTNQMPNHANQKLAQVQVTPIKPPSLPTQFNFFCHLGTICCWLLPLSNILLSCPYSSSSLTDTALVLSQHNDHIPHVLTAPPSAKLLPQACKKWHPRLPSVHPWANALQDWRPRFNCKIKLHVLIKWRSSCPR